MVYCVLEFLFEQGFVYKVELINSYVLCYLFDQLIYSLVMFICDCCGVVKEEVVEGVEDIMYMLVVCMGFVLCYNVIEVYGFCVGCVEVEVCSILGYCQYDYIIQFKKKVC